MADYQSYHKDFTQTLHCSMKSLDQWNVILVSALLTDTSAELQTLHVPLFLITGWLWQLPTVVPLPLLGCCCQCGWPRWLPLSKLWAYKQKHNRQHTNYGNRNKELLNNERHVWTTETEKDSQAVSGLQRGIWSSKRGDGAADIWEQSIL